MENLLEIHENIIKFVHELYVCDYIKHFFSLNCVLIKNLKVNSESVFAGASSVCVHGLQRTLK